MTGFLLIGLTVFVGDAVPATWRILMLVGGQVLGAASDYVARVIQALIIPILPQTTPWTANVVSIICR